VSQLRIEREAIATFCDNCGARLPSAGSKVRGPNLPPTQLEGYDHTRLEVPGTCPACGHQNAPGEMYCGNCGVQLPPVSVTPPPLPTPISMPAPASPPRPAVPHVPTTPYPAPPVPNPPPAKAAAPTPRAVSGRLTVWPSNAVIDFPAGRTEIIVERTDPVSGIYPEADLTPFGREEAGVSRRHARIFSQGDSLVLEDLGSTNFTFLNKNKLQPGQRLPLNNGDEIRCGRLAPNNYS
jgi:pSer/pThr/pTyr-binding forkhead associated (FHA) protein